MDEQDLWELFYSPARGLPIHDALIYYNNETRLHEPGIFVVIGRRIVSRYLSLMPGSRFQKYGHSWRERNPDLVALYEPVLLCLLRNQLCEGDLVAKGYTAPGQLTRTTIPADWWTRVRFDVDENWAEAHGTRVLDVHVFHSPETESTSVPVGPENAESTAATPATAEIEASKTELSSVPARQERGELTAAQLLQVAAMEPWYRDRADSWRPGMPIPSLEADRQAAKRKFGQEHRTTLNLLRRKYARAEWRIDRAGRKPAAD